MGDSRPLAGELEVLYRQRYRHFLRVATAILADGASGHDAVQDGFAQAVREQRSVRGEGVLEAWVWRLVVNAALAGRRRRVARREAAEAVECGHTSGQPSDELGVRAWVAALPERQRLAVYL